MSPCEGASYYVLAEASEQKPQVFLPLFEVLEVVDWLGVRGAAILAKLRCRAGSVKQTGLRIQVFADSARGVRERPAKRGDGPAVPRWSVSIHVQSQTAASPPSTKSSWPTTKLLSLDAKKSTAFATSSRCPRRPSGTPLIASSSAPGTASR